MTRSHLVFLILLRWLDVLGCAAGGFLICLILGPVFSRISGHTFSQLSLLPFWAFSGAWIWLFGAFGVFLWHLKALPRKWNLGLVGWPPVWLGGMIAAGVYATITNAGAPQSDAFVTAVLSACASCLVGVLLGGYGIPWLIARQQGPSQSHQSEDREQPIRSVNDDKFNMAPIARRVANLLQSDGFPTIAIVGPFGAGKTSVIGMAAAEIAGKPAARGRIQIRTIDAWGYRDRAVTEAMLSAVTDELALWCDCSSLTMLPRRYISAISELAPSGFRWLTGMLGEREGPCDLLRRIDRVAGIVGVRIVVCLEDLDRNNRIGAEYVEVLSLLDRLKSLSNVSFVFTVKRSASWAETLCRTCEHIEQIPALDRSYATKHMIDFRDRCLAQWPDDVSISSPAQADPRMGIIRYENMRLARRLEMRFRAPDQPVQAIAALLPTPRQIKTCQRAVETLWEKLHGEVNFDDLLMLTSIRLEAPNVFAWILDRIASLRALNPQLPLFGENVDTRRQDLEQAWSELETGNPDLNDLRPCRILVATLFPGFDKLNPGAPAVQSVVTANPVDYWDRYLAGEIPPDQPRDQEVLHFGTAWLNGEVRPSDQLVARVLTDPSYAELFIYLFQGKIDSGRTVAMLEKLCARVTECRGRAALEELLGTISVFAQGFDSIRANEWANSVFALLLHQIDRSIALVAELGRTFYKALLEVDGNLDREFRDAIKDRWSEPSRLSAALSSDDLYALRHLIFCMHGLGEHGKSTLEDSWSWLGPSLLRAAEMDHAWVVPTIAAIAMDEDHNGPRREKVYTFRRDRLVVLFGKDAVKVLRLMSKMEIPDHPDEAMLRAARSSAQTALEADAG